MPLLDEAAELLGVDDRIARSRAEREREEQIAYAQGVLDVSYASRTYEFEDKHDDDAEVLSAHDIIDAERFAERQEEDDHRSAAERAAADRTWAFGHIIVDEAQELSPMAWRLLMRRCPTRSMTLVGDPAQTAEAAGVGSWSKILAPYVEDRWEHTRLGVNYRTLAEIMDLAAAVVRAEDPSSRRRVRCARRAYAPGSAPPATSRRRRRRGGPGTAPRGGPPRRHRAARAAPGARGPARRRDGGRRTPDLTHKTVLLDPASPRAWSSTPSWSSSPAATAPATCTSPSPAPPSTSPSCTASRCRRGWWTRTDGRVGRSGRAELTPSPGVAGSGGCSPGGRATPGLRLDRVGG